MAAPRKAAWPKMLYKADGSQRVFDTADDVPPRQGWISFAALRALDHDRDGRMGGGPAPRRVREFRR